MSYFYLQNILHGYFILNTNSKPKCNNIPSMINYIKKIMEWSSSKKKDNGIVSPDYSKFIPEIVQRTDRYFIPKRCDRWQKSEYLNQFFTMWIRIYRLHMALSRFSNTSCIGFLNFNFFLKIIQKIKAPILSWNFKEQEEANLSTFLARASAFLSFCFSFFFWEGGNLDIASSSSDADFKGESYSFR